MASENLREVFEALKDYVPVALALMDIGEKIETDPKFTSKAAHALFDKAKERQVSFEEMEATANALGYSVVEILKTAKYLHENEWITKKEVIDEFIQEQTYQIWKEDQENL